MSVQVGVPTNFGAVLQDNGNQIPLPAGSVFDWSTDNDADQIVILDDTTQIAQITVAAADPSRTSITVTASTTAPDGSTVSGSDTTELIPGAETHVYTVAVSQFFTQPVKATRGKGRK